MTDDRPHVVIIGGGFGGLYAARALRRAPARVTVIDRRNHHLFLPLLYQVATAGLNPGDFAAPIRRVLRGQANAAVLLAHASSIDVAGRRVALAGGEVSYDYLIVASGARHAYFGHAAWARSAPGLTDIGDALEVRRRLLLAYESAEREEDPARRREWLTTVVVGAGPTGVELAGAIAEMGRHALPGEFRRIDPASARVVLLEGADRVLPTYPWNLSANAERALSRLGVEVRTGTRVSDIDGEGVLLGCERIAARSVFWAAGVRASPLAASLGVPLDRSGRVLVRPDLTVAGHGNIFVIGDAAAVPRAGGFVPGLAPAAVQQGRHAARNIIRALRGAPYEPFDYKDRGSLATIGRAAAVADFGRFRLTGFIAWAAWLAIHIFWLIGFRNRFLVMFQWAWAYLTYDRGVRLLMPLRDTDRREDC